MGPFQVIIQGTTDRTLKPMQPLIKQARSAGWHFTFSDNHWSNLSTMKQFVSELLAPWCACLLCNVLLISVNSAVRHFRRAMCHFKRAMAFCRLQDKIKARGLPDDQKAVALMDCWSVHKSVRFCTWWKKEYPWLLFLFVPAGRCPFHLVLPAPTSSLRPPHSNLCKGMLL